MFLNAGGFGILDYEFTVGDSGGTLRSFPTAQQVPEPSAVAVIGLGLALVVLRRRRLV